MLWALVSLLGVAVVALVAVAYHLIRQHGRILLRLEALERRAAERAVVPLPAPAHAAARPPGPRGLAPGTSFPPFRLPDLAGRTAALEDFRGRRILLVNWSPQCGYCDVIASELAQLRPALKTRNTELVLVSYGDAGVNRRLAEEHGLDAPILLQDEKRPIDGFQTLGTPVAYLLDEEGKVARPLAVGAQAVPELAAEAAARKLLRSARSLESSRIERNGRPAGTQAPPFTLPDLAGRPVALDDFRGRRVLLIFSDPQCGPCDALASELARLARAGGDDAPALLMIGRGDPEANRRKAREHGIEFPVLLQDRWKLSKQFGIFATPAAFLIDEHGRIAENVAIGPEPILALARPAPRVRA